jgi:hypothetical protein
MIMTIKFLVNGGVLYPKIRAQIDNACASRQEWFGKFGREAMRQGEKNKTGLARELFWIRIGKLKRSRGLVVRKAWENLRERFAGQLAGRCRDQIDLRMREEQTRQFFAGVTGSANHRDFRSCHNAQCVFRLARIATNIYRRD